MADLFADVDQSAGPFANVVLPTSDEAPPNALVRFRRAQVVAAANVDQTNPTPVAQQFDELQQTYLKTSELYGDTQDDVAVAERRRQRQINAQLKLSEQIPNADPQLQLDAVGAAQAAVSRDIEQDRKHALEQEAVDNILDLAASGNRTQAEALIGLMEQGDSLDRMRDFASKQMILQREIDRASLELSDEPWFSHVANFVLSALPLNSSMGQVGNVELEKGMRSWLDGITDNIWSGGRRRVEAANLWQMPIEQFTDYVRKDLLPNIHGNATLFGYTDKSEELNLLTGLLKSPEILENNVYNSLDNFGMIGFAEVAGATKFATNLPRMLSGLGARREASGALAQAAARFAAEGTEEAVQRSGMAAVNDVADALTPTIARADGGDMVVPLQAAANVGLENGLRIADGLERVIQTGRFADDAERQAAIDALVSQSTEIFGANRIVDVRQGSTVLADNSSVNTVEFVLGKNVEEGWSSQAHADRYKNGLGFADAKVFQGEGNQWFVSISRNVPETGFYTNTLNVKTNNVLSRFLLGARQRSDEFLANRAQVSENTRNKVVNDHVRQLFKDIRIDPASTDRVSQLWALGDSQKKWFDLDEANIWYQRGFGRDISPREWKAYQGLKDINDFEYAMRNDIRYKELAIQGYETVSFDAGGKYFDQLSGVVDDGFNRPIRGRAYNRSTGGYSSSLSADEIQRLKDEGYVMVHLSDVQELPNGRELSSIIMRRDELNRSALSRNQLPYRSGGHRIYKEKNFVKQAVRTIDEDGNEIWKSPKTYMVGTKAEADEWAKSMEAARRIAISSNPDLKAIDDIFAGRPGFPTAEDFMSDKYNKDYPFQSMFDRDLPSEYDNLDRAFFQGDPDEEGITSYLRTHGRLYYSQKGDEALVDWQGAQAPTLNAYESVNRAFMNIANLSSFNDYKLTSVERWLKKFDNYIDSSSVPANASGIQRFLDGKASKGSVRDNVRQAMEDQRDIIKRNLGWKTEMDSRFEEMSRRFSEFVMGSDPTSLRHGASRAAFNWFEDKNPIQSLRGMAFDLKLGMFNPVQLFLQAGTFLAITAIDPVNAGKSVITNPLLRRYLMRGAGDETLNAYIKAGYHKAAGFSSPEEFQTFMRAAKSSGFFSINESHSLVNAMGPNTVNLVGNKVQDIRQMGRFFFNEGETINRMSAYRVAWDRTLKKYGGPEGIDTQGPGAEGFLNEVFGEAEKFAFSMSRPSQASWQQGITSIPTQFFAYQARMMEMMFGGQLSKAERARLIMTQALLYGASGVPLAGVMSDLLKAKTGEAPDINTPLGIIDRGFMDWAINATTGADVLAGQRLGTGRFLGDTVGDLFGFSKYGETNTMDVLGGATYSITEDVLKSIAPFLKYVTAESGGNTGMPLTERALKELAMNISSVSNVMKAHLIFNYGLYTTSKGRIMADDVPQANAFAQLLLGAAPAESDQISAMMSYQKNKTKITEEATRVIEQYRTEIVTYPERADELSVEINAFVGMLDPIVRRDALSRARNPEASLLDSLDERMAKEMAERDMIKQLEGSANSGQSN